MAGLAGVILVFIVAAVCYPIGMRYLLRGRRYGSCRPPNMPCLWIVFLATAWLLREHGHITTDLIYTHLNERTKRSSMSLCSSWVGGLRDHCRFGWIIYGCASQGESMT